jgi:hypothetical protein
VTAIKEIVALISSVKHSISDRRKKNKNTKINRNITNLEQYFITVGQLFEGVQKFKYLGSLINSKNVKSEEIKLRIAVGDICRYSLEQIFRSTVLSKTVKTAIYKLR